MQFLFTCVIQACFKLPGIKIQSPSFTGCFSPSTSISPCPLIIVGLHRLVVMFRYAAAFIHHPIALAELALPWRHSGPVLPWCAVRLEIRSPLYPIYIYFFHFISSRLSGCALASRSDTLREIRFFHRLPFNQPAFKISLALIVRRSASLSAPSAVQI